MDNVIGLSIDEANKKLSDSGFLVHTCEYVSRRGIEHADSTRVIRQRDIGNNTIEITVSHFKTIINED